MLNGLWWIFDARSTWNLIRFFPRSHRSVYGLMGMLISSVCFSLLWLWTTLVSWIRLYSADLWWLALSVLQMKGGDSTSTILLVDRAIQWFRDAWELRNSTLAENILSCLRPRPMSSPLFSRSPASTRKRIHCGWVIDTFEWIFLFYEIAYCTQYYPSLHFIILCYLCAWCGRVLVHFHTGGPFSVHFPITYAAQRILPAFAYSLFSWRIFIKWVPLLAICKWSATALQLHIEFSKQLLLSQSALMKAIEF